MKHVYLLARRRSKSRLGVNSSQGQATIEFALTLLLLMAFVLFFIHLSLILGFSNYVQYATFMASRAYTAGGPNPDEQTARATNVIQKMLKKGGTDRFGFIGKGVDGDSGLAGLYVNPPTEFNSKVRNSSWMQGIRYKYRSRVFLLPLGKQKPGERNTVDLISESWLGREVSHDECKTFMGEIPGIWDNGC
jgi:hypothetical protein